MKYEDLIKDNDYKAIQDALINLLNLYGKDKAKDIGNFHLGKSISFFR